MNNLTVVVPFRNGHATIGRLLDSLPGDQLVVIVDDLSDAPLQLDRPNVRVVRLDRRGYFAGAVNRGIRECQTDVLVLNQDIELAGDAWQTAIAEHRDEFGIIGDGVMGHAAWPQGYVQGTFMFLARRVIDQIGRLNEQDYPLWGSTCEYQLRACRAGHGTWPIAEAERVLGMRHARGRAPYGEAIAAALREEPARQSLFIRTPPAVSVVIACHNYGQFLTDAINSLIGGHTYLGDAPGQSFQSFEVVLVDYGSTDGSQDVCDNLASDWNGIHVIHTRDEGTAQACNAGIEASHGKYIAILDADDMMRPSRLEKMYRVQIENPHSVVFDDIRIVHHGALGEYWNYPEYDFEQLLEKNTMHKGLMFPKSAWQEVGGYPRVMTDGREDWAFNIALGLHGWCGVRVPEDLYLARRGWHNRSSRNTNPLWHQRFMERLHALFPDIYAGERPDMCCGGNKNRRWKGNRAGTTDGKPLGATRVNGSLPGAEGMVLLEYTAPDYSDARAYHGDVTGTPYWFGKLRTKGYVDARDAPGFLKFMGGIAFRVAVETTKVMTDVLA